ncbi:MAG: hypothetical protein KGO82_07920 [Bacteroidota bacterium]|nr:hypothetical protein [Bacteroidota bacterium]
MIITHPWLFNAIVALFIAFTSGWLVFVLLNRRHDLLRQKIYELEADKELLRRNLQKIEEETGYRSGTPATVISIHQQKVFNQGG